MEELFLVLGATTPCENIEPRQGSRPKLLKQRFFHVTATCGIEVSASSAGQHKEHAGAGGTNRAGRTTRMSSFVKAP